MPDIKKVIEGLEICEKKDCVLCPYKDEKDETYSGFCEQVLKQDALALLKEQEAVEPVLDSFLHKRCPVCGHEVIWQKWLNGDVWLDEQLDYCPHCGRAVKWNA